MRTPNEKTSQILQTVTCDYRTKIDVHIELKFIPNKRASLQKFQPQAQLGRLEGLIPFQSKLAKCPSPKRKYTLSTRIFWLSPFPIFDSSCANGSEKYPIYIYDGICSCTIMGCCPINCRGGPTRDTEVKPRLRPSSVLAFRALIFTISGRFW